MNVVSGSCTYKQAVSSLTSLPSFKSYWTQSTTLDICNSKGRATLFLAFESLPFIQGRNWSTITNLDPVVRTETHSRRTELWPKNKRDAESSHLNLSHHTWIWAVSAATWCHNTDHGKGAELPLPLVTTGPGNCKLFSYKILLHWK